jgi:hypothetical protein
MAGGGSSNQAKYNLTPQAKQPNPQGVARGPQGAPAQQGGFFAPSQSAQGIQTFDPYQGFNMGNDFSPISNAVMSSLGGHGTSVGNPYVGPNAQQQGALDQIQGFSQQASPAFGKGVQQMEGTIGGQYLDPMQTPAFQRLASARMGLARQLFGEFAPETAGAAIARGNPFQSSSQQAEIQRGGERIGTQAAQDIAQAGWGQYGAERGLQEAASNRAQQLAPGLAGQVFSGNETLRAAQQSGNQAQMEAELRAQGLDNNAIQTALEYMRLRAPQRIAPIQGDSPATNFGNVASAVNKVAQNIPWDKVVQGISSMYGSGGSGASAATVANMFQ